MMTPPLRWSLALLCLAAVSECSAQPAAPDTTPSDAAIIERILDDWRHRWERTERVSYTLTGTRVWKAESIPNFDLDAPRRKIPKQDMNTPVTRAVEIDFRNARARHESELTLFGPSGGPLPNYSVLMFDGTDRVIFSPRDRQPRDIPRSHITTDVHYEDNAALIFFKPLDPLLFAHGIVGSFPDVTAVNAPRTDPSEFHVVGRETVDGCECVILSDARVKANRQLRFWVDLDRQSAIRRMHHDDNGR